MVTSDERREVAERMRVYSHDFDFRDSNPFWYVAKAAFGDVDTRTYYSVFARLADLIDPTCENMYGGRMNARTFSCSECGYETWTYDDSDCDPWEFSYCPNCGARVVSGDDR